MARFLSKSAHAVRIMPNHGLAFFRFSFCHSNVVCTIPLSAVSPISEKAADAETVNQSNTDIITASHFPHDFMLILS
ncbi:hypothetical protein [Polycladomyces zharkentensis]|uniref:hypothetical protein n=1 Tax=Polycladomyces zharkentensis TaxID=2807616 RepID=UPI001966E7C7|nr:hypothetical protein [Polycladomyces sp. WAk]